MLGVRALDTTVITPTSETRNGQDNRKKSQASHRPFHSVAPNEGLRNLVGAEMVE